jgi:hypothetical protein
MLETWQAHLGGVWTKVKVDLRLVKLLSYIISITISASTFAISLHCISGELDRSGCCLIIR